MSLKYIKNLDGVRALAIILVIIWHYISCMIPVDQTGYAKFIKLISSWTWSGVDLFFVLSGFLIGRILMHNQQKKNYFKTFYIRRVLRIFPAYYLIVLLYIILLYTKLSENATDLFHNPLPFYSYFLYIQNFWMNSHGFGPDWLSVTWSLAIEEQFYLLLPLIIYLVNDKYLPVVFLTGIIGAPICRAFFSDFGSYVLLPARMDSLLIGALIAYYYLKGSINKLFENKIIHLSILLLLLFCVIYFLKLSGNGNTGDVFIHSVLALLYGSFLILALITKDSTLISSILSNRIMVHISKISYMTYLTHMIFLILIHQIIMHQIPHIENINDILITLIALLATFIFSTLTYYIFEKPVLNIGKRFRYE